MTTQLLRRPALADGTQRLPQVLDLLCFATQGAGSADEQRLSHLLKPLRPRFLAVDRRHKQRLPLDLLRAIERRRPDVIVVEGTGAAGGVGVMSARLLKKVPYIVSSGDAVEPYLRAFHRRVGLAAKVYEHSLYGCPQASSAGLPISWDAL